MRKLPTALLAAAGLALTAGGAYAASERMQTVQVALPDGSVAQIRYSGDIAPRVRVVPVEAREVAAYDPFVEMERISAMMQARHAAMMREMAELQRRAATVAASSASGGVPGGVVVTGNVPAGTRYSYTVVTSNGNCTQRVEYRSDGSTAQPKVTQASSGDCSAVPKVAPVVPAAAPARPAAPAKPATAPVVGQTQLPSRAT
jgi:hypothetical protein